MEDIMENKLKDRITALEQNDYYEDVHIFESLWEYSEKLRKDNLEKLKQAGYSFPESTSVSEEVFETSSDDAGDSCQRSLAQKREMERLECESRELADKIKEAESKINLVKANTSATVKDLKRKIKKMEARNEKAQLKLQETMEEIDRIKSELNDSSATRVDLLAQLELKASIPRMLFNIDKNYRCQSKEFCEEFCMDPSKCYGKAKAKDEETIVGETP